MGLGVTHIVKYRVFAAEPLFKYVAVTFFLYLIYKTIIKRDKPSCLILALTCALIIDEYMGLGLPIPGMDFATVKYSEIVLITGLVLCKQKTNSINHTRHKILKLFLIYAILFAFGCMRASTAVAGYNEGLYAFRYEIIDKFLFFLFASEGFRSRNEYIKFLILFGMFAMLASVPNIQMYLHGWDATLFPISERQIDYIVRKHSQHAGRYGGYFLVSNRSGVFCTMVLPFLLSAFVGFRTNFTRVISATASVAVAIALLTTGSRSAMLGIIFALVILLYLYRGSNLMKMKYTLVGFAIVVLVAPTLYSRVIERFETIEHPKADLSAAQRLVLYNIALKIIAENPLFGIGYGEGNFSKSAEEYGVVGVHDNPHNSYLQIATMLGLPALFVFLSVMYTFFKSAFRRSRELLQTNSDLYAFHAGLISGLSGLLVSVFFNPILFVHSISATMWIFLGLAVSLENFPILSES